MTSFIGGRSFWEPIRMRTVSNQIRIRRGIEWYYASHDLFVQQALTFRELGCSSMKWIWFTCTPYLAAHVSRITGTRVENRRISDGISPLGHVTPFAL